jgi:hypothetical protein
MLLPVWNSEPDAVLPVPQNSLPVSLIVID